MWNGPGTPGRARLCDRQVIRPAPGIWTSTCTHDLHVFSLLRDLRWPCLRRSRAPAGPTTSASRALPRDRNIGHGFRSG